MAKLSDQWEELLRTSEAADYLAARECGKRGWIPRWMIADFLRKVEQADAGKDGQ